MMSRVEVLRAVLRCSRHRRAADLAALRLRVDGTDAELDQALETLGKEGLVHVTAHRVRLTMAGLAVAVASVPQGRPGVATKKPKKARSAA